jgi:EAL domain-containing protein (putative c-di-GMP-specific phosphodiesterase class I)/DNA-binding NarL/FixJ family response regulator
MESAVRLRVLIADDDPLILRVVSDLVTHEADLELVGVAGDAPEAVSSAETLRPDVALLDVSMPGGGGPVAARGIASSAPGTRVVAYSGHEDGATVREMLRAGAVAFCIKGGTRSDLLAAIRRAAGLAPRAPAAADVIPTPLCAPTIARVLLVHQDAAVLEALGDAIDALTGVEVLGLAQAPSHARSLAARHRPDLALIPPGSDEGQRLALDLRDAHRDIRLALLHAIRDGDPAGARERSGRYVVQQSAVRDLEERLLALAQVPAAGVDPHALPRLNVRFSDVAGHEDESREARARALLEHPIPMALQPMVWIRDNGTVAGYEALARFPDGRTPDVVFAEAHRFGVGEELELHALSCAISHLEELPEDTFLSVNVRPDTLLHPAFEPRLEEVPGERVVIELTEHAPVRDYAALQARLDELRSRGFRIAIDDCGAGFASLRHVVQIAPDFLKLDVVLCRDVRSPVRWAMARALAGFASETGTTAVAEGVEDEADLEALVELGVPLAQGWLLGHPVPAGA